MPICAMHPKIPILKDRIKKAYELLKHCQLCPRRCGVNRIQNELGYCGEGLIPNVASDNLHYGEEPPISGFQGSGTLFFAGCTMRCVYCQNYPISHMGHGHPVQIPQLADMMLHLQKRGAHNINLVTPTHFIPQIITALYIAYHNGLILPIVYNTSGFESVKVLRLLEGIVDIYLPDMKYANDKIARSLSNTPNYPEINQAAILEMYRQVGHLKRNKQGIAIKGLIIRHLMLPGEASGTKSVLQWIAENLNTETHISLMRQYFPTYKALDIPALNKKISHEIYMAAARYMQKLGFKNGWLQD
ncbi:radical SAM protein [bacterium]|nr:radical SAM protein [bacterium]